MVSPKTAPDFIPTLPAYRKSFGGAGGPPAAAARPAGLGLRLAGRDPALVYGGSQPGLLGAQ